MEFLTIGVKTRLITRFLVIKQQCQDRVRTQGCHLCSPGPEKQHPNLGYAGNILITSILSRKVVSNSLARNDIVLITTLTFEKLSWYRSERWTPMVETGWILWQTSLDPSEEAILTNPAYPKDHGHSGPLFCCSLFIRPGTNSFGTSIYSWVLCRASQSAS